MKKAAQEWNLATKSGGTVIDIPSIPLPGGSSFIEYQYSVVYSYCKSPWTIIKWTIRVHLFLIKSTPIPITFTLKWPYCLFTYTIFTLNFCLIYLAGDQSNFTPEILKVWIFKHFLRNWSIPKFCTIFRPFYFEISNIFSQTDFTIAFVRKYMIDNTIETYISQLCRW